MADVIQIRFLHNQVGMLIEARESPTADWQVVQLEKYRELSSSVGWGKSSCISPHRQEQAYLNILDARGIHYQVIQEES